MKEVFEVQPEVFTTMVTVDVIVANIWMAFLLFGAGRSKRVDAFFRADSSAIDEVRARIENYRLSIAKMPALADVVKILGVGFAVTSLAHFFANGISAEIEQNYPFLAELSLTSQFFWLVVIATTVGLLLSLTRVKKLEGVGASRLGGVMIYILVATIGLEMNVLDIAGNPGLFIVGLIWMLVHVTIMLTIAYLIKAPFFFTAVGSQANVGGAASAPVVASAFHESLAPVGVLLAVLGYAVGTYGAYLCGILMQWVAGGIG
jgi:uncharacterized membrane protein